MRGDGTTKRWEPVALFGGFCVYMRGLAFGYGRVVLEGHLVIAILEMTAGYIVVLESASIEFIPSSLR